MTVVGALADPAPIERMNWTFDPWRETRGRAFAAACGAVALISTAFWLRLPLPIVTALSLSVLALLSPGFVPTYCSVDARGVSRRIGFMPASTRAWHSIHAVALTPRGLYVSTREWRAPMSALQQMSLPIPAHFADDRLVQRLRSTLEEHGY